MRVKSLKIFTFAIQINNVTRLFVTIRITLNPIL